MSLILSHVQKVFKGQLFFWKWGNANPNQITKSHIRNPLIQKVGFCKVLSLLEGYLDLILSPSTSLKIQIKGRNIVKKSVVQIPALEDQKKFTLFLFLFKSSIQNWIVCINYPSISCFKNQVSIKTNISYLISIEYNEISKNGQTPRYPVLYGEFEMKRKKIFLIFQSRDSIPDFLKFRSTIWFIEGDGS